MRNIKKQKIKNSIPLGFTLLELMIVIAIAGIMVALSAPSLSRVYKNQQLESAKDLFLRHLNQARLEAKSRGESIGLCVANQNMNACETQADRYWGSGWLMFVDRNANGVLDNGVGGANNMGEVILQKGTTVAKGVGIYQATVANGGRFGYIGYDPQGRGRILNNVGIPIALVSSTFCMADTRYSQNNSNYVRRISVDFFGRAFDRTKADEQITADTAGRAGATRCGGTGMFCAVNTQDNGRSVCQIEQI